MKISKTVCEPFPSTLRAEELEAVHGGAWNCRDADGHVPEYNGRLPGNLLGYAHILSRNPCQRAITYDVAKMNRLGAGPNDWRNLIRHERGHTQGWDHGAGNPATNPAFHDTMPITGR
jgi:hypothetical protein